MLNTKAERSPLAGALTVLFVLACGAEDSGTEGGGSGGADQQDTGAVDASETESDATDCDLPGDDILWVSVPAGSFSMGCSDGDARCAEAESPSHTVTIAAFQLTATEITQAQYVAVIGSNPSKFDDCPSCPVESVRWSDAVAYCEGVGGRLPTEAEWEYAARSGSSGPYPCGQNETCLDGIAWYQDNAAATTHPVATKAPNGFCLYDVIGNVWEWVEDCWHDDYSGAPASGDAWLDSECTYRVQRGGAYGVTSADLRSSTRGGDFPDIYFVPSPGFRCARSAP